MLTVIRNNKKRVKQKENGKFHSFNRVSLQQTPTFQKIRKTTTLHRNKNKTKATLGGLPLGELSGRGLKIFEAFAKGNSLKGLDEENWPLGRGDRSITCGLCSLLGSIRVLTFIRPSHTGRLAFLGWLLGRSCCQNSSSTSSLNLFRSVPSLGAGWDIFLDSRGIVHVLHLP